MNAPNLVEVVTRKPVIVESWVIYNKNKNEIVEYFFAVFVF